MDEKIKVWSVKNYNYIEGCDILKDGRIVDKNDNFIDLVDMVVVLNTTIKDVNNENIYEWDILENLYDETEYIIKYDMDIRSYILKPTIYLNNSILNPKNTFNFNKIYIDFLGLVVWPNPQNQSVLYFFYKTEELFFVSHLYSTNAFFHHKAFWF